MKKTLVFLVAVVALCWSLSSCQKTNSTPVIINTDTANAPINPDEQKMLDLVNNARLNGCNCGNEYYPPVGLVTWNGLLESAAKKHSEYMDRTGELDHKGENNSNAGTRISNEGYQWQAYGENIAEGYSTEEEVMKAWLNSQGHCKNIMNGDFKEMGVGTSGSYWTQVFGVR